MTPLSVEPHGELSVLVLVLPVLALASQLPAQVLLELPRGLLLIDCPSFLVFRDHHEIYGLAFQPIGGLDGLGGVP